MRRREFLSSALSAPAAGFAATKTFSTRKAKVVKLFKSPEGHPNGLEATSEGLWIGEQVTDRAHLVDWKGNVLRTVDTESSNTSGIAYGGGYLWMAANGKALWRAKKPTDASTGAVIQVDPASGETVARHEIPGGGGVHGIEFAEGTLWITSLRLKKLSQVDPNGFQLLHQIPVHLSRAHGLGWDPPGIWCMHSNDYTIHKLHARTGEILDAVELSRDDPDPHGMCFHEGRLYYCDAGIGPGATTNKSPWAGYVCRIDIV